MGSKLVTPTEAAHRLLDVVRGDQRVGRPRRGRGAPGNVGARVGVPLELGQSIGGGSGSAPSAERRGSGGEGAEAEMSAGA
jgi:hypothetical protein